MPEIRYRRHDKSEPEMVVAYGREFEDGEYVLVDDKVAAKARGNPSFEVKGEKTYGDTPAPQRAGTTEEVEARARAAVAREGARETEKAKQAEARGARHSDERG